MQELHVYHDRTRRSAAMNMALDEALFEYATVPSLRFYRWARPSLSFGYFGLFAEVADQMDKRDIVRRWTGGGIVMHGDDLTYSVILPRADIGPRLQSRIVYRQIHDAIRRTLSPFMNAQLAASDAPAISASCFANPVAADVLLGEKKIAGAAHRRTRAGLLHQGSIQGETLPPDFPDAFAAALCSKSEKRELPMEVVARAEILARDKYGTDAWLRQR
ncbi:MAG: lipoate--protein ligase family protein [Chthoniobacterales bacterium]